MKMLQTRGKIITIGGILKNYEIQGPDINKLLFERAKYLGMKPKQKKKKRDFGYKKLLAYFSLYNILKSQAFCSYAAR